MRDRYDEIKQAGGEVVAVGTGNRAYAAKFVEDERLPFAVYVDDHAEAANIAAVRSPSFFKLVFNPQSRPGSRRAREAGHRIHRAGKRVTQLGATFVVAPGNEVRYQHLDEHSADHAPIDDVVAAIR